MEDGTDVFGGATTTKDDLSGWFDIFKAYAKADVQTRVISAQGEQDRLLRQTELQYGRGNPVDIRSQPAATTKLTMPSWVIYLGMGILVVGGGALLFRAAAKG